MSEKLCTVICPNNIQSLISGVTLARIFPSGKCQLAYSDGNIESANLTADQLSAGREDFFSLVSAVQSASNRATL